MASTSKTSAATKFELNIDDDTDIMEKIDQLLSAPISNSSQRAKIKAVQIKEKAIEKNITHRFRFPKVQNHEYCDSCSELGDLLNCDRCTASFHLQCHDPPLDEDTVPKGQWLCWRCQGDPKIFNDLIIITNGKLDKKGKPNKFSEVRVKRDPVPTKVVSVCMPHLKLLDSVALKEETTVPEKTESTDDVCLTNGKSPSSEKNENPLLLMSNAMQFVNPTEFSLPKDTVHDYNLPGTDKPFTIAEKRKCVQHKLDSNGLVPLPVKFCYTCGRTCRISPLIQCDYCPLLYHTECLNPPINTIPKERWMCPNHIQNFIDEQLGENTTFTEKIAIYTKFNVLGEIDQKSIKIDFLNHANTKHPRFRRKIYRPVMNHTKVPLSVKHMYEKSSIDRRHRIMSAPCKRSISEDDEWLMNMVSLQVDLARRLSSKENVDDESPPGGEDDDDNSHSPRSNKDDPAETVPITNGFSSVPKAKRLKQDKSSRFPCLECLDENTIFLLASQRLTQLQPVHKLTSFPEEAIKDKRKAKAMLSCIDIPMNPILIIDRSIKLGKGTDNDICLDNFGTCNNVSNLQAFIYYDQIEKNYELINYSEHGTMVDGIVYGLSHITDIDIYDEFEGKDEITILKETLKQQKQKSTDVNKHFNSFKKKFTDVCTCKESLTLSSSNVECWEGGVTLHNNSRIQFGCLRFRFSFI